MGKSQKKHKIASSSQRQRVVQKSEIQDESGPSDHGRPELQAVKGPNAADNGRPELQAVKGPNSADHSRPELQAAKGPKSADHTKSVVEDELSNTQFKLGSVSSDPSQLPKHIRGSESEPSDLPRPIPAQQQQMKKKNKKKKAEEEDDEERIAAKKKKEEKQIARLNQMFCSERSTRSRRRRDAEDQQGQPPK